MTNIEQFDLLTGVLLGDLYNSFPVPLDVKASIFLERVVSPDDGDTAFGFEQVFSHTVRWLDQSDYIRIERDNSNLAYHEFRVNLSEKGLHSLRKLPSSLGSNEKASIGELLAQKTKRLTGDVITKLIMEAVDYGVQTGMRHL